MLRLSLPLLLSLVLLLSGCQKEKHVPEPEPLVGQWQDESTTTYAYDRTGKVISSITRPASLPRLLRITTDQFEYSNLDGTNGLNRPYTRRDATLTFGASQQFIVELTTQRLTLRHFRSPLEPIDGTSWNEDDHYFRR